MVNRRGFGDRGAQLRVRAHPPRLRCGRSTEGGVVVDIQVATGLLLILVPVVFNVAFFELGRAFDYPAILRREPD